MIKEKLVFVNRVSKTIKGGRIFGFTALTVVGDDINNKIGFAYEKAKEVPLAISKSFEKAKKRMEKVELYNNTIPCYVTAVHISSKVVLIPSFNNTGIISSNTMKSIFYVLGIENIISKSYGSSNPINIVIATIKALKKIKSLRYISKKRNLNIKKVIF
ncbi:30S ribosomal protein S5 [Candidatus Nardonella dryophthoridicola]|uniref:Small ribosomal subunit protein uS5 n=1 Tax=endosymbiont of Rhynchophorus ferrugineus TaxID=1972133 RepID=A0A2Z5T3Z2_9GAMM|nr:30S ribosomal protein S5 [Candidatus Nardonella dryophthoridicola]QTJ62862.1 30S ribosomal protein S5 [Candidatus Nardonella dryophthoridicola]BBA85108.1 30S ribosomal protein S5 [endosymbiont of Rhynchophorus ferrugineus]